MLHKTSWWYDPEQDALVRTPFGWAQVREMRQRYKDGQTVASLAQMFHISYARALDIIHEKTWKEDGRLADGSIEALMGGNDAEEA